MTFFYKYVFIVLWSGIFGISAIETYLHPNPKASANEFITAWLIGTLLLYLFARTLKKVTLTGSTLQVSNYFRTETIELGNIESVSGSVFFNPELVWFHLNYTSSFGRTIVFIPKIHIRFALFTRNPMVEELKAIVEQHRGAG